MSVDACMYTEVEGTSIVGVHEQSYYIVRYIRRKEEGKEGRKKQTNTNNVQQPQRLRKYIYMCMHSHTCTCIYIQLL